MLRMTCRSLHQMEDSEESFHVLLLQTPDEFLPLSDDQLQEIKDRNPADGPADIVVGIEQTDGRAEEDRSRQDQDVELHIIDLMHVHPANEIIMNEQHADIPHQGGIGCGDIAEDGDEDQVQHHVDHGSDQRSDHDLLLLLHEIFDIYIQGIHHLRHVAQHDRRQHILCLRVLLTAHQVQKLRPQKDHDEHQSGEEQHDGLRHPKDISLLLIVHFLKAPGRPGLIDRLPENGHHHGAAVGNGIIRRVHLAADPFDHDAVTGGKHHICQSMNDQRDGDGQGKTDIFLFKCAPLCQDKDIYRQRRRDPHAVIAGDPAVQLILGLRDPHQEQRREHGTYGGKQRGQDRVFVLHMDPELRLQRGNGRRDDQVNEHHMEHEIRYSQPVRHLLMEDAGDTVEAGGDQGSGQRDAGHIFVDLILIFIVGQIDGVEQVQREYAGQDHHPGGEIRIITYITLRHHTVKNGHGDEG